MSARAIAARLVAGAACAFTLAGTALAADIELTSAWMRPAEARSDARAYVDIASDAPLTLVGATSPAARKVELVRVTRYDGSDPGKVVPKMAVAPGKPTRLAYKGSHLRLVGVRADLLPGKTVPITLQFRDAAGKRLTAQADVLVHGVALPMPPERPAATN
jgi:periplasmic copper chaperone A